MAEHSVDKQELSPGGPLDAHLTESAPKIETPLGMRLSALNSEVMRDIYSIYGQVIYHDDTFAEIHWSDSTITDVRQSLEGEGECSFECRLGSDGHSQSRLYVWRASDRETGENSNPDHSSIVYFRFDPNCFVEQLRGPLEALKDEFRKKTEAYLLDRELAVAMKKTYH